MKGISEFKKSGLSNFNNEEWLLVKGSSRNIMGGSICGTDCTSTDNGDGTYSVCCGDNTKDK